MNELVSIIVPIYKVEKYLSECIDSILRQTYPEIEVILVDDGSPDHCGEICDAYSYRDDRVRVIHKENGGLSDARNAGLDIATGAFFYFVDSDDILPPYSVEKMLTLMKTHNGDMVIGGFERFRDNDKEIFFSTEHEDVYLKVFSRKEAFCDFYRDGCQAWAVLYKREIHESVRFPKGEINEDEAVIFSILEKCRTVVVTNQVVYSYRCREESITTTEFSPKKLAWVKHCRDNLAFIREKYPELEYLALARYRTSILWSLTEIAISRDSFENAVTKLTKELRDNAWVFWNAPFAFWQDRIRMILLMIGPFSLYRMFIRKKRGITNGVNVD